MALKIPWDLFRKYFEKSLSDKDRKFLDKWRSESDLNDTIYNEIMEDISLRDVLLSGKWENHSVQWQSLLERIKVPHQITFMRKRFYLVSTAAASIVLLVGTAIGFLYSRISNDQMAIPESYTYIFSPRGQQTRVIMPDSSFIWLNGESSIRYSTNYNEEKREVFLNGEAYFEVEKNPGRPFLVNADDIMIKVYGTSFNVKAFPNENTIETTLIDGELSIIPLYEESVREIHLKPNEKCLVEKGTEIISTGRLPTDSDMEAATDEQMANSLTKIKSRITIESNINSDRERLWKEGEFIFRNESFGDLAVELERWFDVKIHFEDESIKTFKFTGSFEKETINQAMEALRLSSQKSYQYEIVFRDIYLKSN